MIKYTTIESATLSFARIKVILSNDLAGSKRYFNFIQDLIYDLKHRTKNCNMGLLWNALTEANDAKLLHSLSKPEDPLEIHADSGGLQIITLGYKVDEQGKRDIYTRQGKYSTHAMSFDKMPILVDESAKVEGVSMSLNHSAKYFVRELLYDVGRESGYNVVEQCKTIAAIPYNERQGKVLIIIQGSEFRDYQEYARGLFSVFNELPEEERELYLKQVDGISMGMSGITNYFDLMDLYCRVPVELTAIPEKLRNLVHFLGVGGPTKIAPLYAINDNFFGKRDIHYTFDSTSRTSTATYGRSTINETTEGFINQKANKLGRKKSPEVQEHVEYIRTNFKHLFDKHFPEYDISNTDKFRNIFSSYRDDGLRLSKDLIDKFGEEEGRAQYIKCNSINDLMHWASELIKFFMLIDDYAKGEYRNLNDAKLRKCVYKLHDIKDYDEYMKNREYFKLNLVNIRLGNINILETMEQFNDLKNQGILEEDW